MNIGWHDLCLATKNIKSSTDFYKALGMQVTHETEHHVHLTNGNVDISLMTFLKSNLINFRGADVLAVRESFKAQGIEVEGEPRTYTKAEMGCDGTDWTTKDPEGNLVYFDTTEAEAEKSYQVRGFLDNIERQLETMGIESAAFGSFRDELTEKYVEG